MLETKLSNLSQKFLKDKDFKTIKSAKRVIGWKVCIFSSIPTLEVKHKGEYISQKILVKKILWKILILYSIVLSHYIISMIALFIFNVTMNIEQH